MQSPERLKLLLVLTAADIRAVGPKVWNGWKGALLRELYHSALDATLINGTASHALDYDDVSGVLGGHRFAVVGLQRWLRMARL